MARVQVAQLVRDAAQVGDIVSSMLTEAQFQSLKGTGWVLADGRSATGTSYATITGSATIPDLRGVFLRGKNNGRSTTTGNASADRALGYYEGDAIRNITGTMRLSNVTSGGLLGSGGTSVTGAFEEIPLSSGLVFGTSSGSYPRSDIGFDASNLVPVANENRTRNVTVNIFIKIN